MATACRLRFPSGYSGYRPDLGAVLKIERKKLAHNKQQTMADMVGISRQSLSAIENGHAWPRPDTMEKLSHELNLNLAAFLMCGTTARKPRFSDDSPRADQRHELGRALRNGRELEKLSLQAVAQRSGMSAAQLSRIERGEATRSRAYMDHADDMAMPVEFRRVQLRDPELWRLCMLSD